MDEVLKHWHMEEQDERISEAIDRDRTRVRNFIRSRVPDPGDAEDILQEVFYELVEAYRMMKPIEQVTAWLFRVARNRITDLFRRKQREMQRSGSIPLAENGETLFSGDLLPSADAGPEAAYTRSVLLEEVDEALNELPEEQRLTFTLHHFAELSLPEVAEIMHSSTATTKSRLRLAREKLREKLSARGVEG